MIEILYDKKSWGYLPENYNELSGWQLIEIADLFLQKNDPLVTALKALRALLQMNAIKFQLLPVELKTNLLPHISWVFEKNGLTEQHIPFFNGWFGPASEWNNLTMAEWNACEIFYAQIADRSTVNGQQSTEEGSALDNLVSVLYRPPKKNYDRKRDPDGDCRIPFNANEIPYHAKKYIRFWPLKTKTAILIWYDGCRQYVAKTYDVFSRADSSSQTEGMFETMRALCGEKYGDFEKVEKLNVHVALRELELMKQESDVKI